MNQAIRNAWTVTILMFLVLLGAASYIQVIGAEALNKNEHNSRQIYQQFGSHRGPILVGGEPIAESVQTNSENFEYQRQYHDPELYSGLTGFYSLNYGATGLESKLNDVLSGTSDNQFVDRARALFTGEQVEGAQVELTIDPEIQELLYSKLPEGIKASAVATDPSTGQILGMVSRPSYDTNLLAVHSGAEAKANMDELQSDGISPYRNSPTQDRAFPGSTFKLIDTIAMLESGDYTPDTTLDLPNSIDLPQSDRQITNFGGGICANRNSADLGWIFAQSCNTPFATAAMDLGQEEILDVAERFGFNQSFDMPLQVDASYFPTEDIPDAILALSSLGQHDVQASALQMNMVAAGIANGGTVMKPQLVDAVRGPDLSLLEEFEPEVFSEATSEEVADEMTQMMRRVVQEGTASTAGSSSVDWAAKTGTGQRGTENDAGEELVNSWITAFAPADDPQIAVTLVYENVPYSTGSSLTVSNMKDIMETVVTQ